MLLILVQITIFDEIGLVLGGFLRDLLDHFWRYWQVLDLLVFSKQSNAFVTFSRIATRTSLIAHS